MILSWTEPFTLSQYDLEKALSGIREHAVDKKDAFYKFQ